MQHGLRKIRRRDGCLPNRNLDPARAGGGLRFDPRLAVPNQDQQAPLGPGMFNGRAHECIDQLFLLDLTRYCLRYADDRRQVKLLDGGENGARVG